MNILLCLILCIMCTSTYAVDIQRVSRQAADDAFRKANAKNTESPYKHVVMLMYENRALDHLLGHLKQTNPDFNGLTGKESNPWNPDDPAMGNVNIALDAPRIMDCNPDHSISGTRTQLFGPDHVEKWPAPMNGFVASEFNPSKPPGDRYRGELVMKAYNSSTVPAISTLATEFGVSDEYHSSVPGPTEPNRLFAMSGTSHGAATNDKYDLAVGYPQTSIWDQCEAEGIDWKIYFHDFPTAYFLRDVRFQTAHIWKFQAFLDDARNGELPQFAWIDPQYADFLSWKESDQHPRRLSEDFMSDDMFYGEALLKAVYEALYTSPQWNDTLLLVMYDEHGGLYDHVSPPHQDVPNPDGLNSTDPPFTFNMLGIRVPLVAVSPRLRKGSVIRSAHQPSRMDHTSLLNALRTLLGMKSGPLTKRDAWSDDLGAILLTHTLAEPRTDCPPTLPLPSDYSDEMYTAYLRTLYMKPANTSAHHVASHLAKLRDIERRALGTLFHSSMSDEEFYEEQVSEATFWLDALREPRAGTCRLVTLNGALSGRKRSAPITDFQRMMVASAGGLLEPYCDDHELIDDDHSASVFMHHQIERWLEKVRSETAAASAE